METGTEYFCPGFSDNQTILFRKALYSLPAVTAGDVIFLPVLPD